MNDIEAIREWHQQEGDFDACEYCGSKVVEDGWPCDTRVVLDALDESKADTLRMGQNWEDALTQRDAARVWVGVLAEALRDIEFWLRAEVAAPRANPHPAMLIQAAAIREALRQHDAAKEASDE